MDEYSFVIFIENVAQGWAVNYAVVSRRYLLELRGWVAQPRMASGRGVGGGRLQKKYKKT